MANNGDNLSEVKIGNVSGGIHGSIIAGQDVSHATITVGGQPMSAQDEPTPEQVKQALAELKQALAELAAQKEALAQVSPSAPYTAQGAEASVNAAAEQAEGEVGEDEAKSIQKSLEDATGLLGGLLDGAKTVAEKATDVGRAVKPIAEKLEPVVEKLAVVVFWVGRLWLGA